jgi:hypothetical protein
MITLNILLCDRLTYFYPVCDIDSSVYCNVLEYFIPINILSTQTFVLEKPINHDNRG